MSRARSRAPLAFLVLVSCLAPVAGAGARELAHGRPVRFTIPPNYARTVDPLDSLQLTDGRSAARRGQQGVVKLRFVVDGQGQVLSFELAERSASGSLDRATLEMIRRAQPLPAPPAELLQGGRLELVAPVVYSLEQH